MLFNSLDFLIFFPIVVLCYFALPHRYRWIFLLAASYYFYAAWKPEYLILIIISTLIDYTAAIQMAQRTHPLARRTFLVISLFSNLGMLFAFKYFNFFSDSLRIAFNQFNIFYNVPTFQVLLPVGISFYTFQTLSYTIDVYRRRIEPEKHLGIFALFVAFFPQLVAGPIERAKHMLPQFHTSHHFDEQDIIRGLRLILWGMFKKVVIADRLALYVDAVYSQPADYHGWPILIATYFFAFQIYCDFSGYSDIAIGAAKVMGFDLMQNFKQPYFARSIGEFWQRWHISLSSWFRDYLYIPLGGNRVPRRRWYTNLMIVFVVSGLWHGASWTFVAWGFLHGLYLVFEIWSQPLRKRLTSGLPSQVKSFISIVVTFNLVCFAWIFFRANSIIDSFLIIRNLFSFQLTDIYLPWATIVDQPEFEMWLSLGLIIILLVAQLVQFLKLKQPVFLHRPLWFRWAAYLFLALLIMNFGVTEDVPFIYFQF